MKHDIPLLKSDLDFKWLNAWRLLPCAGLAKKQTSNGNRNCDFFFEQCVHFSNNSLYKHFSCLEEIFFNYPANGRLPFGKYEHILTHMVCFAFKNNTGHNMCNASRIYCLVSLHFLTVGGSPRKLPVLTSNAQWPTLNCTIACWDLQTANQMAAAMHFFSTQKSDEFRSPLVHRKVSPLQCAGHANIYLQGSRHFSSVWERKAMTLAVSLVRCHQ